MPTTEFATDRQTLSRKADLIAFNQRIESLVAHISMLSGVGGDIDIKGVPVTQRIAALQDYLKMLRAARNVLLTAIDSNCFPESWPATGEPIDKLFEAIAMDDINQCEV